MFGTEGEDQTRTYEWYHSTKRGMTNMDKFEHDVTNLVITGDRLKGGKVLEQAQNTAVPVVSVLWVHLS